MASALVAALTYFPDTLNNGLLLFYHCNENLTKTVGLSQHNYMRLYITVLLALLIYILVFVHINT